MADLAKVYNYPETVLQNRQSRCAVGDLSHVPAPPEAPGPSAASDPADASESPDAMRPGMLAAGVACVCAGCAWAAGAWTPGSRGSADGADAAPTGVAVGTAGAAAAAMRASWPRPMSYLHHDSHCAILCQCSERASIPCLARLPAASGASANGGVC